MFRLSGVYPNVLPITLQNQHFYDLCHAYEEIATRIPELRKVDTFSPRIWLKHFDEQGNPRATSTQDTDADDARERLRSFLHNNDHEDIQPPIKMSRRLRKLANWSSKDNNEKDVSSKGLFD